METDRRKRLEAEDFAIRAITTACSGSHEEGPHRAATAAGTGSNHYSESSGTKVGARGIHAYPVRANSRTGSDTDGKMGRDSQEVQRGEERSRTCRQSPEGL